MKTIFRLTNLGLMLAALLAFGAVAGFAQDPCQDADGQTKASDNFDTLYANKTDLAVRQQAIDAGKAFLDKYGNCEPTKAKSDWLKVNIPKMEANLADRKNAAAKTALLTRFNNAMTAKNWDDVYTSGKEILSKYGDEFSAVELVLGSIGYDELFNNNSKYNDQTLQYAKQALGDLDAGKQFKPGYGVAPFVYKSSDDAKAWMNLTIGSIYYLGKKDKQTALPYLYKATQTTAAVSDVAKNPNPYEFIGNYYFDELNKLVEQIQGKIKDQKDTDPADVIQKKADEIKALVAQSNGYAERAMDAFARAYTLGTKPEYKKKMKDNVAAAYKVRFGKEEPVDTWIAQTVSKPFPNPTTPPAPITDPEPTKTTSTTGASGTGLGAANGSGIGGANGSGIGGANGTGMGAANGNGLTPGRNVIVNTKPASNTTTNKPTATPAKTVTKPGTATNKGVAKKIG